MNYLILLGIIVIHFWLFKKIKIFEKDLNYFKRFKLFKKILIILISNLNLFLIKLNKIIPEGWTRARYSGFNSNTSKITNGYCYTDKEPNKQPIHRNPTMGVNAQTVLVWENINVYNWTLQTFQHVCYHNITWIFNHLFRVLLSILGIFFIFKAPRLQLITKVRFNSIAAVLNSHISLLYRSLDCGKYRQRNRLLWWMISTFA